MEPEPKQTSKSQLRGSTGNREIYLKILLGHNLQNPDHGDSTR